MRTGLATTAEVAAYLKVKPNTLDHWASSGEGPAFVKLNGRRRYDWKAVYEYAGQNPMPGPEEPAFSPSGYVAEYPDGTILPVVDFAGLGSKCRNAQARVCWNEWGPGLIEAVDGVGAVLGTPVIRPLRSDR